MVYQPLKQRTVLFSEVRETLLRAGCKCLRYHAIGQTPNHRESDPRTGQLGPATYLFLREVDGEIREGFILAYTDSDQIPDSEIEAACIDLCLDMAVFAVTRH